jgi:23S rRNA-/tRNA-specific pseudouridylate synthase
VVRKGDADMRLDRWLKLQLPHLPNSLFQKLLRKRKVLSPFTLCTSIACVSAHAWIRRDSLTRSERWHQQIKVVGAAEKQLMAEEERESEGGQTPAGKSSTKLDGKRHLQPGDVISYPAYLDTLKLDAKPRVKREMKPLSGKLLTCAYACALQRRASLHVLLLTIWCVTEEDTKLAQSWVIYKDNRLIALNKPPGLPVQGSTCVVMSDWSW